MRLPADAKSSIAWAQSMEKDTCRQCRGQGYDTIIHGKIEYIAPCSHCLGTRLEDLAHNGFYDFMLEVQREHLNYLDDPDS